MKSSRIDYTGLNCYDIIAALWNNCRHNRSKRFREKYEFPTIITASEIDHGAFTDSNFGSGGKFIADLLHELGLTIRDFQKERPDDTFDPRQYDKKNGRGLAKRVIDQLRGTGSVAKL
ncbi:MAG TPA: hypothetical protein VK502_01385 [Candidatus Saccharimonadales bacterium]|nr:hypothetical protein [Candidatus Saccharimonadales bacterium]